MRRLPLLVALAAVLGLGSGGGPASAAVFCVNKPTCLGTPKATLQDALDAAAANGVTDSIFVDANGGTPYNETLSYTDSETVNVIGDGVGETIIAGTGSSSNAVTLLNPTSTIEELTIRAPNIGNGAALRWNGTASNIEAVHLGSAATSTLGMVPEGGAVLESSTVDINGSGLMELTNATGVKVRDSTLRGHGGGIGVGGDSLTLERSTVIAKRFPIQAGFGSSVNVFNALLKMTGTTVDDGAISVLSGGELVARHLTVVGAGNGSGVFVDATTGSTTVTVFDSIFDNFEVALGCFGEGGNTAKLGVSHSNWTDETQLTDAECEATLGAGNDTLTDPVYVSTNPLLLDFRLKAPSPLIDAGDPADPLSVDLEGLPREVDGDGVGGARSDMGAYEYQRQTPTALISATGGAGRRAIFSASGSSDPDPGDVLSYQWDFGDGTSAEGFSVQHTFPAAGPFTIKLKVTDPTGLSATDSAGITFNEPEILGTSTGPRPPRLLDLRAVPKRVKRGKGKPRLLAGAKKGIRFELSAPARVTLTLRRCLGLRGCAKTSSVAGAASFNAPSGVSTIRFKSSLVGKQLPPGRYLAALKAAGGNTVTTRLNLI